MRESGLSTVTGQSAQLSVGVEHRTEPDPVPTLALLLEELIVREMMNRLRRAIWTNAQLMADGRVGQLGPNVLYHVEELELKRETGPAQTLL